MFIHAEPAKSKTKMIASLSESPVKAKLTAKNTLDYVKQDGTRIVRLHNTDILAIKTNGAFTVSTGGWNTVTTRARLNDNLPQGWSVYTNRGAIYLRNIKAGASTVFRETISVGARGAIRSDTTTKDTAALVKLIDGYMKAYKTKGLPHAEDSKGDPWVWGNPKVSRDTMLDWLRTKYIHRRMYSLALDYAGVTPQGIDFFMSRVDRRNGKLDRLDSSRIRRFIRACVGLEA